MPELPRNWMRVAVLPQSFLALEPNIDCRNVSAVDADRLGHLMYESYTGTVDSEGETLDQCVIEMRKTLDGKYGKLVQSASFVAVKDAKSIACATIVTIWKERPLLAFTMTHPKFQRQGLATHMIKRSVDALSRMGHRYLYLVVTRCNFPAEGAYKKLGFELIGPSLTGVSL